MDLRIRKLQGHYIVCGYGRVGQVVSDTMSEAGVDFVVVDTDPQRITDATEKGYLCLEDDATQSETLVEAGVKRASGLVCALQSDADNLFVALSARTLNERITIVTRCVNADSVDKLQYAGADRVISPYEISGRRMADFLLKPGVYDYLDLVAHGTSLEYRLEEIFVEPGSEIDGNTIGEMDIKARTGALILAVRKKGGDLLNTNPDKETRIDAGDLIVALGMEKDLAGLERMVAP